ncbi:hypothetical protein ACFLYK_02075 [Candidatus Cloacimonadota bacterium]
MDKKLILIFFLVSVAGLWLYSQEGPAIQVTSIFDRSKIKWLNHITVNDQDGIKFVSYKAPGLTWQHLQVDPYCALIQTWSIETNSKIRDVRAEDCSVGSITSSIPDTVGGNLSQWHYDDIYNETEEAVFIAFEWLFDEPKDLRIISVRVTSGNLTDENGEPLDPSDFVATGGGFRGFVGKVKGTGTLEIILDPEGDLNIFVFDIYSDQPDTGLLKYLMVVIIGFVLLILILLLFKRRKT